MRPIIGITSGYCYEENKRYNRVKSAYIDAIKEAGGIPLIIPLMEDIGDIKDYIDIIDGILFTGGRDLSPLLYGENPIKKVDTISYVRDKMEIELFNRAYEMQIPILGICRGLQIINVALGGNLYQDINIQLPYSLGHVSTYDLSQGYHSIDIIDDTILYDVLGVRRIDVNSNHHQSIKDLGKTLRVNSLSQDSIIEGIESIENRNFILGLQFHPESMIHSCKEFLNIFQYFVIYCR